MIKPPSLNNSFFSSIKKMDEKEYLALLLSNDDTHFPYPLPRYPSEQIQKQFVGSSFEHAMQEGLNFYLNVKWYCKKYNHEMTEKDTLLDFGCGWGRMTRLFFHTLNPKNITGVDVDPDMIDFCKKNMEYGSYAVVPPRPPSELEDNSFDFIIAYSVFSHLEKTASIEWIKEFKRILKPNGLLFATTQGRWFLDYCAELQGKKHDFEWHNAIASAFNPIEKFYDQYDHGNYIYCPTGGGGVRDKSYYGEALIPKQYVIEEFGKILTFVDFINDKHRLPQALFILKKDDRSPCRKHGWWNTFLPWLR